jgi:selenocysteine lyase/cysteine desulfurase
MEALRAEYPVLERVAYLNAGSIGPSPAAAAGAAVEVLEEQTREGRLGAQLDKLQASLAELRELYAPVLGCDAADIALATSTSDGIGRALAGFDLGPGAEIVTSDSEHPGLVGPLIAARERGVTIRAVPLRDVADAVTPRTTLVACSHVSWHTGEVAPAALAELDVPVVLDGAQGAGAIPVDVRALRCAAYAAAGQKWLCGAHGTGMLYVAPELRDRIRAIAPGYMSFEDPSAGLDSRLRPDARLYDTAAISRETAAYSIAATRILHKAGFEAVHARATGLARRLADALAERGRTVAPRGDTTLVAWEDPDPPATRERLAAAGVVIRDLPGTKLLRASVGAWNDDADLARLLKGLSP